MYISDNHNDNNNNNSNDNNKNNNSFQKLLVPGWVMKLSVVILKDAVI